LKVQGAVFEGTGEENPVFSRSDLRMAHTLDLGKLASNPPDNRRQSLARRSLGGQPLPISHNGSDEDDDEINGEMDMDMTMNSQDREREARRKSLAARRVSFAPNAHIR